VPRRTIGLTRRSLKIPFERELYTRKDLHRINSEKKGLTRGRGWRVSELGTKTSFLFQESRKRSLEGVKAEGGVPLLRWGSQNHLRTFMGIGKDQKSVIPFEGVKRFNPWGRGTSGEGGQFLGK